METKKVYKTENGRVTVQKNAGGTPEIKVRIGEETKKIRCHYQNLDEVEKVVEMLLQFYKTNES